tara:strand:- start:14550 stop:15014 length:465 start_codon:yes stop_codon:yes gene_type:complete
MGSTLKVDNIVGTSGTSAPITLSGDTATLGSGVVMAANHSGVKTALNASGTAPIYACRAWVNFNGTGTIAIRGSGNVSSITDNGNGGYTVNFTTALPDTNYSAVTSAGVRNVITAHIRIYDDPAPSTTFIRFEVEENSSGAFTDTSIFNLAIFR